MAKDSGGNLVRKSFAEAEIYCNNEYPLGKLATSEDSKNWMDAISRKYINLTITIAFFF